MMKKVSLIVVFAISFLSLIGKQKPVDYVDMFVGTSNSRAMLGPYAGVPYGMVQLGPDNQDGTWMGAYEYSIMNVLGFSHIHAWAMGGLMVMPGTQDFTNWTGLSSSAYRGAGASIHSRVLKETEEAHPGYYSVFLYDADCKAEMTATTHCGFHRYTFNNDYESARIMFLLNYPMEYGATLLDAKITKASGNSIEGVSELQSAYGVYKVYFKMDFSKPFKTFNGWNQEGMKDEIDSISGKDNVGGYVDFAVEKGEDVMIKVGLSLVDIEGARKNLNAEMNQYGWDFDAVREAASDEWNQLLSKIRVEGSEENKCKFYTNLYRSFAKQQWSDVDGRYVDPFEKVQKVSSDKKMYGGDAFWNSYWNYNTILSLIAPDIMNNWVNTQLELFDKTGWTNNGPTGLEHTGIMEVTHEIALMVSAYQKGIRGYDVNKLYEAVSHNSKEQGRRLEGSGLAGMQYLDVYKELGYVPYEKGVVCQTLDYSYTDYCAAQLAKALKHKEDYNTFIKRSNNWKNQFNIETKWQTPRSEKGTWLPGFDVFSGKHWVEGNSWQYTWYVPHDIDGLVKLMGKDLFNQRLEEGFEKSMKHKFAAHAFDRHQDKAYEYYVNHGNEVNMQAAYLFNYSGKPWLTQKYSRLILDTYYGNTPYSGWEGDEDEGQMGGWFVISSMGIFEMNGGVTSEPIFDLTSPLFDEIEIELNPKYHKGRTFKIKTINNSKNNVYIQSAKLNGKLLKEPKLKYKDMTAGGELILEMGSEPNKDLWVEK